VCLKRSRETKYAGCELLVKARVVVKGGREVEETHTLLPESRTEKERERDGEEKKKKDRRGAAVVLGEAFFAGYI